MISARNALNVIESQIERMSTGSRVKIESFKKDRWLEILALPDDKLELSEHGFLNRTLSMSRTEARGEIKRILAREFPRSNMLRLHRSHG